MNSHNRTISSFRAAPSGSDASQNRRPACVPMRVVTSEALFSGEHEIGISTTASLYRLKITRQGKLILNK